MGKLNAGLAAYLAKKKSGKATTKKAVSNFHSTKGKKQVKGM
jgi:hypothetical protein